MSAPIASSLRGLLAVLKSQYIDRRMEDGGTADGFREKVKREYVRDPKKFEALVLDALMEASTRTWQQPPRKRGPDLFAIDGYSVPETLTRPAKGAFATGEMIEGEGEEEFEKVGSKYATVADLYDDGTIKMRKAAQSSGAAERVLQAADEARRRAKGKLNTKLKDIQD